MKNIQSDSDKPAVLKLNKDFRRLYGRGKSCVYPSLVIFALKNSVGFSRYGITAGKKVGNAVKRNRSKRVIRAAFYSVFPSLPVGYDFVFVARGKTPFVKSTDLSDVMMKGFLKIGVIK